MSKYNLFVELAVAGDVSELKDTFDYLVRDAIESRVEGMRPEVHAAIFGSKTVESFSESTEKYHIKFKDKSGQWFKSRSFKSQNEMNQHFWSKIKPASTEVQFHGPKGRIAEDVNLLEATEADVELALELADTFGFVNEDLDEVRQYSTNSFKHIAGKGTVAPTANKHNLSFHKHKSGQIDMKHNGTKIGQLDYNEHEKHFEAIATHGGKNHDAGEHSSKLKAAHSIWKTYKKHAGLKESVTVAEGAELDEQMTLEEGQKLVLGHDKHFGHERAHGYVFTAASHPNAHRALHTAYPNSINNPRALGTFPSHEEAAAKIKSAHKEFENHPKYKHWYQKGVKKEDLDVNFGKFNRSAITVTESVAPKFVYEHVMTEGFHDMSPEAHELVLHADNTQHLHKAQSAYVKNMQGHMKKGKYSPEKGKKLFGYYADHVAKDYHKEHGDKYSKWHHVFPKKARDEVAAHFEAHHREESEHHLKSVKEDVNMFSEDAHSGQVLAEEFHEMSHAARELTLHADNTHHLYQAQTGYVNNMKTHMRKGNYSHEKGKKLWGYYADHAAKDYHKSYGDKHTPWHKAFTKKDREQVAHHFESHHRDELKHSGEVH